MTLRLSSSRRSGSRQIHRSQKKRVKFTAMSSPCWSFFWHPRHCPQGFHTPWSKRQWQVLLWGSEAAERRQLAQMSRRVEKKQSVSPPWQCARSHITRCLTIPDFRKHYSDSPSPYLPDLSPCDFFLFPRHTHIWELPGMHEIMGNMLGSLYTCPRGLLQRRRWKLGVKVRNFFLWSNSLNFWVAPHTCLTKTVTEYYQQSALSN